MTSLIVVGYAMDETLFFSAACRGADIVAVASMYPNVRQKELSRNFGEAAAALGARQASYLGIHEQRPISGEALESKLSSLGSYERIYTHNPLERDSFRVHVALAVSKIFGSIWVPAIGAPAQEALVLTPDLFHRKVEIMNRYYAEHICPRDKEWLLSPDALFQVESFVKIGYDTVIKAVALNTGDILDHADSWGLATSPYERARLTTTCQLLKDHAAQGCITDILELGACEGEMTALLHAAFPDAAIRAVESHAVYAEKLQRRFRDHHHVTVERASVTDIPLSADAIVLAEMLYYLEEGLQNILERLRAKYLLISCGGGFDLELRQRLIALGWHEQACQRVLPKFEAIEEGCSLIGLRAGTNVRLWGRHAVPIC